MSSKRSGGNRSEGSAPLRVGRASKAVSYAEDSDSSDSDIPLAKAKNWTTNASASSSRSQTNRRPRTTSDASPRPRKKRETAQMAIGRPRPANTTKQARSHEGPRSNLPRWPEPAKLPYDVLLSIFQFAAYPLVDARQSATGGAAWLVKIARLRRDFLEPAMAALYDSPPLDPPIRAHRLIDALGSQTDASMCDYRRKIHNIDMLAAEILVYKCQGRAPLRLSYMVSLMPVLRSIRLSDDHDDPGVGGPRGLGVLFKARTLSTEEVWDLMDERMMKMIHWKWNYCYRHVSFPWERLIDMHQRPCFRDLKSLEICNLQRQSARKSLSLALGELHQLEHITILSPSQLGDKDFSLLFEHARPLRSLSLLYCDSLTSDGVVAVLRQNGTNIRHLDLSHNQSLDLAFLSSLCSLTPRLETLTMDLTFFSRLHSVRGTDPGFAQLLPAGHVPEWPALLQSLQFVHLRKWDTQAAYTFLTSLVAAAPHLRALRYLGVRMSVDADWRDRLQFRNVWERRMVRVFQRRSAPPRRWSEPASNNKKTKSSARQAKQGKSEDEDENLNGTAPPPPGMCDRVEVRIENLRPMDQLLDESNFLDEEQSGDEDYRD